MVRPLIKTGTVLIWYISNFLYSNVTLLDIRIETSHGSLIRQLEVTSIQQLSFFVVCQLLSKHILAIFCDNDVARSDYFLNTNCKTLCNNSYIVSLRQTLWVGHEKYGLALFHGVNFTKRLGDSHPRIDTNYVLFCRVHNKQPCQLKGKLNRSVGKSIQVIKHKIGRTGRVMTFFQCTKFRLTRFRGIPLVEYVMLIHT